MLIATPTTLIALLHATYYGWRQEKIAESAREIAATGRELHKRITTFLEPYAKLGRQLNSAVNAYNQGVGSLYARVLPQLRRIEHAGAGSAKHVPPLTGLDTPAKLIVAPELTGQSDTERLASRRGRIAQGDRFDGRPRDLPPPARLPRVQALSGRRTPSPAPKADRRSATSAPECG